LARVFREGGGKQLISVLKQRWDSETQSYGLRRDLAVPFNAPEASIPVSVRPLVDSDISSMLSLTAPGSTAEGREERRTRLQMLQNGITRCYVAVTENDKPCYMQWLIGPELNDKMQTYFKGIYPRLKEGEALLEGAFTPEEYRGLRIMPAAMAQIAERGTQLGARYVLTFVTYDNIPSLKGCKRSGFSPYLMRYERWHRFRHKLTFSPLPEGTPYPFDN
jgi:hypothetical protein